MSNIRRGTVIGILQTGPVRSICIVISPFPPSEGLIEVSFERLDGRQGAGPFFRVNPQFFLYAPENGGGFFVIS